MRGFTSVRDIRDGPFSVKKFTDSGEYFGGCLYIFGSPITWTSVEKMISLQTDKVL